MQSYKLDTIIYSSRLSVFKAITEKEGLAGWWTPECEIDSAIGGKNTFHFGEMFVTMQIEKIVYEREVVWRCIDQYFKFEHVKRTNDWVGTVLEFRLENNDDGSTTVHFIHEGLTPKSASYEQSKTLWNYLIGICLKGYLENQKLPKEPPSDDA